MRKIIVEIQNLIDYSSRFTKDQKTNTVETGIKSDSTNVVSEDELRATQLETMDGLKEFLFKTFGPMGSNTMILTGNNVHSLKAEYSKDGHKVMKSIQHSNPIEMTICTEVEDITRHVDLTVGDGTTSATILSAIVFRYLYNMMKVKYQNTPPYTIIRVFKQVVADIQEKIRSNARTVTLDDIRDICMISTNGDTEVTDQIVSIYKEYGFDVDIDVSISTTTNSMLKEYDGMTLDEGYSDPAYINNIVNGTCEIHNPRIYSFQDPVDTPEMVSLFERIITENIISPINDDEPYIPTVILAPVLSKDMSALLERMIEILYRYQGAQSSQKPPLLIVTNIGKINEGVYFDIAKLCGCPPIRKYIDDEIQKADEEKGLAANLDNVANFYGTAESVVSDMNKTKFINPSKAYEVDEEGNVKESTTYSAIVSFLESELKAAKERGEDSGIIGHLKRRLAGLRQNNVEYMIGGITIADRDSKRDLVTDAVKNCASACKDGWGYAANFEGLLASAKVLHNIEKDSLYADIAAVIFAAYHEISKELYSTIYPEAIAIQTVKESLDKFRPLNLYTEDFTGNVKTSIMTDIMILDAISKLITLMVTSNQCIVQNPDINTY